MWQVPGHTLAYDQGNRWLCTLCTTYQLSLLVHHNDTQTSHCEQARLAPHVPSSCDLAQTVFIGVIVHQVKALRSLLAEATEAQAGADLFHSLYSSWSHSAGAVLSLCFLAGAYSHACDVITAYAHLPMGVEVLVQIDRLVQLLETPIFTYLRLQLLQPARYPDLIRCAPRIL